MAKYDWHELEDLLVLVAGQDLDAFEALYNRTSMRLFGLCLRILRDTFAAQDVLQEVFLSIWKDARNFEPRKGRALPWMIAAARDSAVERIRSGPRRSMMRDGSLSENEVGAIDDEAELMASYPKTVRFGIEQLQSDDAALLCTAYFDGATYSELASITGLPHDTVKARARRAFKAMFLSVAG